MLRSGEPLSGQWRTVNRHGLQGHFHKGEIIAGRDAAETRIPRILIGGSSNASNWNYRGLYQAATTYNQFDVVQYGTGISAGMYLCTSNSNTSNPTTGTGWVQVSSSTGVWV